MKKISTMIVVSLLCFSMISAFTPKVKTQTFKPSIQLTDNHYGGAWDPDWSPDGSKVIFYQFDSTGWNRHIWTIDLATRTATQLTFGDVVHGLPYYSPDGSRIILSWWGFRGDYDDLAIMNADGTGLQRIPYNAPDYPVSGIDYIHPEFSPDGAKIVFHYGVGTTWGHSTGQVATMSLDPVSLSLTQLRLLGLGGQPKWNPNGNQIIYHTGDLSPAPDPSQIMIMDASGSNKRAITEGPYDYMPDIVIDGKIVFSRCSHALAERAAVPAGNLYLINTEGEEPVQITFDSEAFNGFPAFSPDGSKIVYVSNRSGSFQIWLLELAPKITASIDIDPDSLNLKSKGQWITAYIELPEGYNVADINVSTIMLNNTIPAEPRPTAIGDYDNDSVPDLMVKLNRTAVSELILSGGVATGNVTLAVTGCLNDGTSFEGSDVIRARMPGDVNCDGRVDIFDVVLVAVRYEESNPEPYYDMNDDGRIDILDIVSVTANYGKTYQ